MIFVTVGTHEQPFTRLIKAMDDLVISGRVSEPVFMQTGYTQYVPKACQYSNFLGYDEMMKYEDKASVVITHGGPSTFMSVISKGKLPVVVPRQYKFQEHVNDHQLIFSKEVAQRGYPIIVVEDIASLETAIEHSKHHVELSSHNQKFVSGLTEVINQLVG